MKNGKLLIGNLMILCLLGTCLANAQDSSDKKGKKADCFYEKDLLLYICHGILFENFLLDGKDGEFTKNIFLPAFEKVCKLTGLKPLIVPIPPMDYDIEENSFWYSYDEKIKPLIKLK